MPVAAVFALAEANAEVLNRWSPEMYYSAFDLEFLVADRRQACEAAARNARILAEVDKDPRPRPAGPSWLTRWVRAIRVPARNVRVAGG